MKQSLSWRFVNASIDLGLLGCSLECYKLKIVHKTHHLPYKTLFNFISKSIFPSIKRNSQSKLVRFSTYFPDAKSFVFVVCNTLRCRFESIDDIKCFLFASSQNKIRSKEIQLIVSFFLRSYSSNFCSSATKCTRERKIIKQHFKSLKLRLQLINGQTISKT